MLCQGCLHLAKTAVTVGTNGPGFLPLHLTMADLDIAVQEKCYTCARLRIQFDDQTVQKLDKNALFQGRAIEGLSIKNEFGLLIPYEPKFGRDPELPSGSGYSVVPLPDESVNTPPLPQGRSDTRTSQTGNGRESTSTIPDLTQAV
jgi:hypothetical protein